MKNYLQNIITLVLLTVMIASCGMRKNNSRQIAEKENKPVGTINAPDSTRTSNNVSIYPDANPAPIPNPNPNPPSPNPPR